MFRPVHRNRLRALSAAFVLLVTSGVALADGRRASAAGVIGADRTGAATLAHLVGEGDTLTAIGRRYGVDLASLHAANPTIVGPHGRIRIGTTLRVPRVDLRRRLPEALRLRPERLRLRPVIREWADRNSIPADLVEATLFLESGWNQRRVSSTGAIGVGQLMPATSTFIKRSLIGEAAGGLRLDERRVEDNIRMSARYLRFLLRLHDGDVESALHSYYQGAGSVTARGVYPETRQYAAAVQSLRARFRADLSFTSIRA